MKTKLGGEVNKKKKSVSIINAGRYQRVVRQQVKLVENIKNAYILPTSTVLS